MIYRGSIIKNSDDSGIRSAYCIKIYGSSNKVKANIGDKVLVSVKFMRKQGVLRLKRKLQFGFITNINSWQKKISGIYLHALENTALFTNKDLKFLGKSVITAVNRDFFKLKKKNRKIRQLVLLCHEYL